MLLYLNHVADRFGLWPDIRLNTTVTDDQRRGFKNLVVMCKPHHEVIDIREPDLYTPEILFRWKSQGEANPREAIFMQRRSCRERTHLPLGARLGAWKGYVQIAQANPSLNTSGGSG